MASVTRCAVCEKFNFHALTCSIYYPKKIPVNIFLEKEDCQYYSFKKSNYDDSDDDLPIAKGR